MHTNTTTLLKGGGWHTYLQQKRKKNWENDETHLFPLNCMITRSLDPTLPCCFVSKHDNFRYSWCHFYWVNVWQRENREQLKIRWGGGESTENYRPSTHSEVLNKCQFKLNNSTKLMHLFWSQAHFEPKLSLFHTLSRLSLLNVCDKIRLNSVLGITLK